MSSSRTTASRHARGGRPPRRLRADPGRAGPRAGHGRRRGRCRAAQAPLRHARVGSARRRRLEVAVLPRRARELHPAPRPVLPDALVRCADPTSRPSRARRRRRHDQRAQRTGPLRGLQLRQGGARVAGQTVTRRAPHGGDHDAEWHDLPIHGATATADPCRLPLPPRRRRVMRQPRLIIASARRGGHMSVPAVVRSPGAQRRSGRRWPTARTSSGPWRSAPRRRVRSTIGSASASDPS